ncbi:MAG: cell division protein ZapE [Steroidobacteraceae bacterium]
MRAAYEADLRQRGFAADPAQLSVLERLEDFQRRLLAAPSPSPLRMALLPYFPVALALQPPRGLYIWGGVGRGKSYLMDLFFANLQLQAKQRSHFHRFMRATHDELRAVGEQARPLEAVAARLAARARVICLDELFITDIADAMLLHGLFDGLFRRGVSFVITSNLPPSQLYRNGLQRERFLPAIALLERHLEVVQLDGGADYRLRQLEQADIYLPTGSDERLARMFGALSGEAAAQAGSLDIEGRQIAARRSANGIAWFDFAALCEGPRSANDYVEIARLLHTVLISDVPVFDELRDDPARRFIALVDELYDHDVKLILSAAAAPTQLYRGERLRFDFQRTESRLIQMQSRAYLAREHRP